jgi:glycosyltransferase involved in cell wall biosynthesis
MKPLNILHTESSTVMGGQELRIVSEAAGMVRRGHSVMLAVPPQSWLKEHAERKGVRITQVALEKGRVVPLIFEFLVLIRNHKIDIVNTHGSLDSWTASIAGRLSGLKPIVVRTRHKSTPISKTLRHRILYRRLPHGIITAGETVRNGLIRGQGIDPSRVASIPTGVDLEVYRPIQPDPSIRTQFGFSPQHIVVGAIAFLRDYKGLEYLVEAARLVTKAYPDSRFLIVGDGPEKMKLLRQIGDLHLAQKVVLAGFREDIPQILSAMDVCVVCSVAGEGLPQSLTQAMAMERPVVAAAVGSIAEVVRHRITGLLVPPRDPTGLAEHIDLLIKDPALRRQLAQEGRALVARAYSLDGMLSRTEAFYEQLLDRYKPGDGSRHGSRDLGDFASTPRCARRAETASVSGQCLPRPDRAARPQCISMTLGLGHERFMRLICSWRNRCAVGF